MPRCGELGFHDPTDHSFFSGRADLGLADGTDSSNSHDSSRVVATSDWRTERIPAIRMIRVTHSTERSAFVAIRFPVGGRLFQQLGFPLGPTLEGAKRTFSEQRCPWNFPRTRTASPR